MVVLLVVHHAPHMGYTHNAVLNTGYAVLLKDIAKQVHPQHATVQRQAGASRVTINQGHTLSVHLPTPTAKILFLPELILP